MSLSEKDLCEYSISLKEKPSAKDVKNYVELVQKIAILTQHETRLIIEFDDVVIVDLMVDVSEPPEQTIPTITEEMIQKLKDLWNVPGVPPIFPIYPNTPTNPEPFPNMVVVYAATPPFVY